MSISTDNFDAVDFVRGQKVLDAKEAIERGAYDVPGPLDVGLDNLIARAEAEVDAAVRLEEMRDEELQRSTESDR